jgi:hypothetical protein
MTGIYRNIYRKHFLPSASLLWLAAAGVAAAAVVPSPEIAALSSTSITVTYTPCAACAGHGLEAYDQASQLWDYVGSQAVSMSGLAPGTYQFRTVYVTTDNAGNYYPAYSAAASVTIGANVPIKVPASISEQLEFEYSSLSGDLDNDGVPELLLRAESGNAAEAGGMMSDVLVRQTGDGTISASRPTANELAATSSWQLTELEIVPRDVNIDGHSDLVLRGVAEVPGFAQVQNQILFGVGDDQAEGRFEVRAVDPALVRFSRDINRHLIDPEYYPTNAPLNYAVVVYATPYCYGAYETAWAETSFSLPCFVYVTYYYVVYRDYWVYDWEAMRIAGDDYGMIHGYESAANAMPRIDSVLERVLGTEVGGWDIDELLPNGIEDEATRRGIELFSVIAGIGEAAAQEPDSNAGQPDGDRILLKGRRVLGRGPFHTALEYHGSTVSAYDSDSRALFDGTLVSQVNWPNDHPTLTLRQGYVDGPSVPSIYWASLLAADGRYDDDLPYDLFPSLGRGGYNSNSFVSGLIQATFGTPTVPMSTFVGGERPVPFSEFN